MFNKKKKYAYANIYTTYNHKKNDFHW